MNDEEWRALARQNGQRVTYPNWRSREHWEARSKKDPWVPIEDNRNFWTRVKPRDAWNRIIQKGWPGKPIPADPPSGMEAKGDFSYRGKATTQQRRNW